MRGGEGRAGQNLEKEGFSNIGGPHKIGAL